jgi:hypothetical protein
VEDRRTAFVGIDVAKARNAIAAAEGGRGGEVRYFGKVDATPYSMRRIVRRIASKYDRVQFCYEAGLTGNGLFRMIASMGYSCMVAAPSLIPRKPGGHSRRRKARKLMRLRNTGETLRQILDSRLYRKPPSTNVDHSEIATFTPTSAHLGRPSGAGCRFGGSLSTANDASFASPLRPRGVVGSAHRFLRSSTEF